MTEVSISENLDILYKLGKYDRRVFVIDKKIWNLKLSRINYIYAKNPLEIKDIKRYVELLVKTGRILLDIEKIDCNIKEFLISIRYIIAITSVVIKKIKLSDIYDPDILEQLVKYTDILKIICYYPDFNRDIGKKYDFMSGSKCKIILRFTKNNIVRWEFLTLQKIYSLVPDTKAMSNTYENFRDLEKKYGPSPFIVNPEHYDPDNSIADDVLTTFSKERTVVGDEYEYITSKLFISILQNTERLNIISYSGETLDYEENILDMIGSMNLPNLRLIVFDVDASLDTTDLIRKYSHLQTNIAFTKY